MTKPVDLKRGDIIRHYKIPTDGSGVHRYIVIQPHAMHTETMEDMITYQALYPPYKVFCRPTTMVTDVVAMDDNNEPIFRFMKEDEKMSLRLNSVKDIPALFDAVKKCDGTVELTTDEGDCINLQSELSKKLLAANVFSHGDIVESLTLSLSEPRDVQQFIDLLG